MTHGGGTGTEGREQGDTERDRDTQAEGTGTTGKRGHNATRIHIRDNVAIPVGMLPP